MATLSVRQRRTARGLNVVCRGEGPPVLLLHGIGGNARSCAALAQELSQTGHATMCWDAPGYGDSAPPQTSPAARGDAHDFAAEVDALLDELGYDSAHIIGTSWGGVIAMQVAVRFPHRVRSLVLADSTRGSALSPESTERMLARLPELLTLGPATFAQLRAPRLLSPQSPPSLHDEVRAGMAALTEDGYRASTTMMAATNTEAILPLIQAPTLVIVGEDDIVTGVPESELLADRIPGAQFRRIPQAGHVAIQEQPTVIAALIRHFWKESV